MTAAEARLTWGFRIDRSLGGPGRIQLQATVAASGRPFEKAGSWHWPERNDRSLRVGRLTVENAAGDRLPRGAIRVRKGRVTVEIPTTGLAADQYPLSVSLDVSPEYATADVTYIPSWSSYAAKLAWNGSEYLIVWEEDRAADPNDVFATRVTP